MIEIRLSRRMTNVIIPIEYLLVKMIITIGLGLQAIGIILEGIGLYMAFKSFGPAAERWLKDVEGEKYAFISSYKYAEEARSFTLQMVIIGIGLALQLIGLFVS